MQIWIDKEILSKSDCRIIEQTVARIRTPHDVGRIPLKISSSFASFTADQWRNWVTIFSPISLKGVLPNDHLRYWLLFVRACCLLCTRVITIEDILQADQYLMEFCKQFVLLCGADACTPNMHLHLHLKECLLDYGPVHSFWCFAFERYNGVLGKYHTNYQTIEVQIMRKFLSEQQIKSLDTPSEASHMLTLQENLSGSLHESCSNEDILQLKTLAQYDKLHSDYSVQPNIIQVLTPHFHGTLSPSEAQQLKVIYNYMYPDINIQHFSPFYISSKKCVMADELFASSNTWERSSMIMAYWPVETCTGTLQREMQVGFIKGFLKHKIKVMKNDSVNEITHIFCRIEWYVKHTQARWYGSSATLCTTITYASTPCSFMPIQRIAHRCAYGKLDIVIPPHHSSEKVLVAIPVHLKYSL